MAAVIEQVELPGIGRRSVFSTQSGIDVGVLTHYSGEKDVLTYSADDPDRCSEVMRLDPGEAQALADLLGTATTGNCQRLELDGVVVMPVRVEAGWWCVGRAAASLPPATSTSLVIRSGIALLAAVAAPMQPGDTVLLSGAESEIISTRELLESGP